MTDFTFGEKQPGDVYFFFFFFVCVCIFSVEFFLFFLGWSHTSLRMTLTFCYSGAYHARVGVTGVCHYTWLLWCQGLNRERPATSQLSHTSSYKPKFFSWYLKCAEFTALTANSMHSSGFWVARIEKWCFGMFLRLCLGSSVLCALWVVTKCLLSLWRFQTL